MRSLENEFIANSRIQNPEQIFIAKETHEEIHTALQMIDERDKAYLWYRFGNRNIWEIGCDMKCDKK